MRWTRLVAVSAVAAALAVPFAGWRMLSSAHVATTSRASAAKLRGALEQQLELLVAHPASRQVPVLPARPVIPNGRAVIPPYGGACYVALGRCSLTPCREFAQAGASEYAGTSSGAVLRLVGPLVRAAPRGPGRTACQGPVGMPKILRVSGPLRH